jgi:hypothetical protein
MMLQTYNNFLIGKTLNWFEVAAPILGYLSVVKTFFDVNYFFASVVIYSKEDYTEDMCSKAY